MSDLYRYNSGAPAPLPDEITDPQTGFGYRAPFEDGVLGMLGYEPASPRPDDTHKQTAEWDAAAEMWVMVDRPPAPPAPEPQPKPLGRLGFIRHVQATGGMTDQMLVDARNAPAFAALWIKLDMADGVERDDPLTGQALGALAQAGFLPKGAAAVLDAWPTL